MHCAINVNSKSNSRFLTEYFTILEPLWFGNLWETLRLEFCRQNGVGTSSTLKFTRGSIAMAGRKTFADMVAWAETMQAKGKLYPHDVTVSTEIARIITGGDIEAGTLWREQDLYDAERRAFLTLAKTKATQQRITALLDEGKSIRN